MLGALARSGAFDFEAPLRGRWPLEPGWARDFFLIAILSMLAWNATLDGIASGEVRARERGAED